MAVTDEALLAGQRVPPDERDEVELSLRLAGMAAVRRDGRGAFLRVRNRIFATVFDRRWAREKEAEPRRAKR